MASTQQASSLSAAHSYVASAQEALNAGDSATALERLNRAIELDPKCADAYLVLGLTEFQRGETAKSIQDYNRSLKLQPRSYSAHYNLALAYVRQHELQEARLHLEQAMNLDVRQADAAYDRGIVLFPPFNIYATPLFYATSLNSLLIRSTLRVRQTVLCGTHRCAFFVIAAETEAGAAGMQPC